MDATAYRTLTRRIDRDSLNRETAFDLEVSEDVVEYHAETECCRPDAPCEIVAWHLSRIEKIAGGHLERSTRWVDEQKTTDREAERPAAGTRAANQYGTFQVKHATDAQVRFLRRLLSERDLTQVPEMRQVLIGMVTERVESGQVSKTLASDALDVLTRLPLRVDVPVRVASEKQVAFATRLATERGAELPDNLTSLTPKQASELIDRLMALPKVARPAAAQLESGIYRTESGEIYKVYWNQAKTRMLAKLLVVHSVVGDQAARGSFEYAGMADRFVRADQRMTLEQAKEFGAIYGVCVVCGATLTDEVSIANGIGPVCASRI